MKVHADVLRMAKTEEKRERIKWFYARRVFFDPHQRKSLAAGLTLAKQSQHQDARFLVSLFPDGPPLTREDAFAVFLAHPDDPLCLCWAGKCHENEQVTLLLRSAELGNAWAQASLDGLEVSAGKGWLEKAAAQGDPDGMTSLALSLANGWAGEPHLRRIRNLLRGAAELGHPLAQLKYAERFCADDSAERYAWMRRSATQRQLKTRISKAQMSLAIGARLELGRYEATGCGRVMFEVGRGLAGAEELQNVRGRHDEVLPPAKRAVQLYQQWCGEAATGVLCWLWLAKMLNVSKDVRLMIADLIWEERAAWSERARPGIAGGKCRAMN